MIFNKTLRKIRKQISNSMEKYECISKETIKVYVKNKNIYFDIGGYLQFKTEEELTTAYVFENKVDPDTALKWNVAELLDEMEAITKCCL